MTDITDLKHAARVKINEAGEQVVELPLELWEAYTGEPVAKPAFQPERESLTELFEAWENEPDDTPPGWWDEFDEFLKQNPVSLPVPDLELDDEAP